MSQFGNFFITDAGADLLSKVQAGGTLQFNRLAIGDGAWPDDGADNSAMTGLLSEKVSMGIQTLAAIGGGKANLASIMMYADLLATGFYGKELGLFAQDPDDGEILFSAAYSGALSDWIPATTEVPAYEHAYNLGIAIGNATTLTVQVDQTIVTATVQNLNDHAALTSPHSATSVATAERLIVRDANGRAQVAAPDAAADIARKFEVDAEAAMRIAADSAHASTTHLSLGETLANAYRGDRGKAAYDHISGTAVHGATPEAMANKIIIRDANGRAQVAAPLAPNDIARLIDIPPGFQYKSGQYTGLATATQAITGVGVAPGLVLIVEHSAVTKEDTAVSIAFDSQAAGVTLQLWNYPNLRTDRIISLDEDGFTIASPNDLNKVYDYFCIGKEA